MNRFGVGLRFSTDMTVGNPATIPSVVSDDNLHNNAGGIIRNWVLVDGEIWMSSQSLGVSGDWVIRAIVEDCPQAPCPWDLVNDDGIVGIAELFLLFAFWGSDPGGPPDFDNDNNVGITDLFILFGNWGPCP